MDEWQRLIFRLQETTNNRQREGCKGAAILEFSIFIRDGRLIGWSKPERTQLEPLSFDCTIFDLQPVPLGWMGVLLDLKREAGMKAEKALVVRDGEPVGWFKTPLAVKIGNGAKVGV